MFRSPVTAIFREPDGVIPNSAVLLWTSVVWLVSFRWMGNESLALNVIEVLACVHTMVLASYLVHEAAHCTLFASPNSNQWAGEWVSFIAGASYASFGRIRHMHLRHRRDRADVACFDFKRLMHRKPWLKRTLQALEWAYIPATEMLMHLQIVWRPFFVTSQRKYLPRSLGMLLLRGSLLTLLALWSPKALALYSVAYIVLLHVLNFFDAFHHTFEQFFVEANEPVPTDGRDRVYEQANTYSTVVLASFPLLNLLTLNFGYHNAHHEKAAVPWYRLPALHRELYGNAAASMMPLRELLRTWHRHRVRRVASENYGAPAQDGRRADSFVGAHGCPS
jgi:fatty acid desaturase